MVFQIPLGLYLLFSKVVLKNSDLVLLNRKSALFRNFPSQQEFLIFLQFLEACSLRLMTELSYPGNFLAFATRLTHQ